MGWVVQVKGEGERMGSASGSGHAEDKDVGKSIGKVEGERDDVGNVKGFGKTIGKSEEETVGKSIGKVEAEGSTMGNAKGLGKSVGKSEVESVGKSIGKVEAEGDNAGNARGVGESHHKPLDPNIINIEFPFSQSHQITTLNQCLPNIRLQV